jgi:hypothetical protein
VKKTVNAKSIANLRPFKPGAEWTGNAGGRPQQRPLTKRYEIRLEEPLPVWWRRELKRRHHIELPMTATWGDAIVAMRAVDALFDTAAAKEICDRIEGKPLQGLRVTGANDGPTDINSLSRQELVEEIMAITKRIRARRLGQE